MLLLTISPTSTIKIVLFLLLGFASLGNLVDAQTNSQLNRGPAKNISLELSAEVQDAIQNGVTIMFRCQYAERKVLWFLRRSSNSKEHHFSLKRHALSNQYIVNQNDIETLNMFRSLDEATRYIAAQSILLLESYHSSDKHYSMRLSLNKFELPAPMRLNAFLSNSWDLDTGWVLW